MRTFPFPRSLENTIADAIEISELEPITDVDSQIKRTAVGYELAIPIERISEGVAAEWAVFEIRGGGSTTHQIETGYVVETDPFDHGNRIVELIPDGVVAYPTIPPSIIENAGKFVNGGHVQEFGGTNGHGHETMTASHVEVDGETVAMSIGDILTGQDIRLVSSINMVPDGDAAGFGTVAVKTLKHIAKGGTLSVWPRIDAVKQLNIVNMFYAGMLAAVCWSAVTNSEGFNRIQFFDDLGTDISLESEAAEADGFLFASGAKFYSDDPAFPYVLAGVLPDWFAVLNNCKNSPTDKVWVFKNPTSEAAPNHVYSKLYMQRVSTGFSEGFSEGDTLEWIWTIIPAKL